MRPIRIALSLGLLVLVSGFAFYKACERKARLGEKEAKTAQVFKSGIKEGDVRASDAQTAQANEATSQIAQAERPQSQHAISEEERARKSSAKGAELISAKDRFAIAKARKTKFQRDQRDVTVARLSELNSLIMHNRVFGRELLPSAKEASAKEPEAKEAKAREANEAEAREAKAKQAEAKAADTKGQEVTARESKPKESETEVAEAKKNKPAQHLQTASAEAPERDSSKPTDKKEAALESEALIRGLAINGIRRTVYLKGYRSGPTSTFIELAEHSGLGIQVSSTSDLIVSDKNLSKGEFLLVLKNTKGNWSLLVYRINSKSLEATLPLKLERTDVTVDKLDLSLNEGKGKITLTIRLGSEQLTGSFETR